MEKFIEFNNLELLNSIEVTSLAGSNYEEHVEEINRQIDLINKENAVMYQKARLITIV